MRYVDELTGALRTQLANALELRFASLRKDDDTPLWQGQLLEQTIPDAGLVVWEGAGHYSYLERAADTARVMDHFFKQ